MWMYIYGVVATVVSYLVGRNAKNIGHGFWRSFIFMMLLFAVVIAFLIKEFNKG